MTATTFVHFCSQCYASSEDGSMGGTAYATHCTNCGASGPTLYVESYHVKALRAQASWVGRRFYPTDEDHANAAERERLLKLVRRFPGRSVRVLKDVGQYEVKQVTGKGQSTSMFVQAVSVNDALEKSRRYLPYFDKDHSDEQQRKEI